MSEAGVVVAPHGATGLSDSKPNPCGAAMLVALKFTHCRYESSWHPEMLLSRLATGAQYNVLAPQALPSGPSGTYDASLRPENKFYSPNGTVGS